MNAESYWTQAAVDAYATVEQVKRRMASAERAYLDRVRDVPEEEFPLFVLLTERERIKSDARAAEEYGDLRAMAWCDKAVTVLDGKIHEARRLLGGEMTAAEVAEVAEDQADAAAAQAARASIAAGEPVVSHEQAMTDRAVDRYGEALGYLKEHEE